MRRPDHDAAPDIIARLDAELTHLRATIAVFFRSKPYPLRFDHDAQTGHYVFRFDLGGPPAPIPTKIIDLAERVVADLLDAHARGHGEASPDWDALVRIRGRLAHLLEPVLVPGKSRLLIRNLVRVEQEGPICGPFGDQQIVARGTVYPPDTQIQDVLVFDIAIKEAGPTVGPLGGRSLLDLANTLHQAVREDRRRRDWRRSSPADP
ncbi:MAG: hypothetical protein ACLQHS_16195 [Candidatus Limnocylindrales bacterium]